MVFQYCDWLYFILHGINVNNQFVAILFSVYPSALTNSPGGFT